MDTICHITYGEPLPSFPQSLYALVSRVMGSVRARLGRREGVRGYVTDYVLNRVEKVSAVILDVAEFFNILPLLLETKLTNGNHLSPSQIKPKKDKSNMEH